MFLRDAFTVVTIVDVIFLTKIIARGILVIIQNFSDSYIYITIISSIGNITPVILPLLLAWTFDSLMIMMFSLAFWFKMACCFSESVFMMSDLILSSSRRYLILLLLSYCNPLHTPLFMLLFYDNVFAFMLCFSFKIKQTFNFHILRIVAVQMLAIN